MNTAPTFWDGREIFSQAVAKGVRPFAARDYKRILVGGKGKNAFSFHNFAANYPRFHSVAYFSIAPS